nr:hypothetical protein [Ferrimicrobium acidiphilum]
MLLPSLAESVRDRLSVLGYLVSLTSLVLQNGPLVGLVKDHLARYQRIVMGGIHQFRKLLRLFRRFKLEFYAHFYLSLVA